MGSALRWKQAARWAALSAAALGALQSAAAQTGGTSSPYLVPLAPGVVVRTLLTVGDGVTGRPGAAPYRLVGIPDGLGAFDNGDGTFTLLVNHELGPKQGIPRAHGAPGAFVSRWVVRKSDLAVLHGEDLIRQVVTWNPRAARWNPPARGLSFSRFCSADLPPLTAFYDPETNLGYPGRLFMNGEEAGTEGRAFAHTLDGASYELPGLGKYSFENVVAHPASGRRTVVVGLDDSVGGQVYVYVGEKARSGNPAEKAGLAAGVLYGVKVEGLTRETGAVRLAPDTRFTLHSFGDVSTWSGARLEAASRQAGVTAFQRPEDGAWDPRRPGDFYFVTTASFAGKSRLWRLRFDDVRRPELGGTVQMLLTGDEGPRMMDNLTVTARGEILIQEDPGSEPHLARIWRYEIATGALTPVAEHDPARFRPGGAAFLTRDEESSGIIDVSDILGEGWFLLAVQAHYRHPDPELVEGGQLLALWMPPMGP